MSLGVSSYPLVMVSFLSGSGGDDYYFMLLPGAIGLPPRSLECPLLAEMHAPPISLLYPFSLFCLLVDQMWF